MNKPKLLLSLLALAGGLALAPLLAAQEAATAAVTTAQPAADATPPAADAPKSLHQKIHDAIHDKVRAAVKIGGGDSGNIEIGKHVLKITPHANGEAEVSIDGKDEGEGRHGRHDNAVVTIGRDASLPADGHADAVVAVLGNATSAGTVEDAVVAVLGDVDVTGPVGQAVVAVFGNARVDGSVHGDVVAVMGDLELGPNAVIDGQVSTVGGELKRDPAAQIKGSVQTVTMFAGGSGALAGLHAWIRHALLLGRPLAIAPGLGWAWAIAGVFLALYLLVALLFHTGVERCVRTMEESPGKAVLASVLALLLKPIVFLLVFVTVIGIILMPFLAIAVWVMGLFGKAVALAWLGHRVLPRRESPTPAFTVLAVLAGGLIVTALYLVPVLGFIVYKGFDILGFGIVLYTLLQLWRASRAEASPPPAEAASPAAGATGGTAGAAASMAGAAAGEPSAAQPAADPAAAAPSAPATPRPAPAAMASSYPRAGFWVRMAALFVDLVLVGVVCEVLHIRTHGSVLVVLAAYGAIMWKLRGATVGDIIFNLRVLRDDGREMDWPTSVVRALGCFLSFVVIFLGFIWIAFDGQRQGWHDKIAGTLVVRVPRAQPLV
jgi:uncharacterized RDD family membrane protein YckC